MACLAWIMDSESKNKSSQIALTEKQEESEWIQINLKKFACKLELENSFQPYIWL
jgi:hypothetical protein